MIRENKVTLWFEADEATSDVLMESVQGLLQAHGIGVHIDREFESEYRPDSVVLEDQTCDIDAGWPECWNRQCHRHQTRANGVT